MKIALITPHLEGKGGVESVNLILADTLRRQKHEVEMIIPGPGPQRWRERILRKLIGRPAATAAKWARMGNQYDLVICNGEFAYGINHPRCIVLFHGCYYGFRKYLRSKITYRQYLNLTKCAWVQKAAARGKTILAVSGFIKGLLEEQGIAVDGVIPNCVDTERFRPTAPADAKGTYLFVGNYNYYGKGFDFLQRLAEKGLEIDCLTENPLGKGLRQIRTEDQSEMHKVYPRYRFFIFPSRFEGMQMSALEAMACGLPVVMSNVGLGPELKERIPEFVVDGWGDDAVAEYLRRLALIENDYASFSRRARQYVEERHSLEVFRRNWEQILRGR